MAGKLQREVEVALRKVRRERGRIPIKNKMGRKTKIRPLSFDFAHAFICLLQKKYQGGDTRAFEEVMEALLDALSCFDTEVRSAYKSVAGHVLGLHGLLVQEKNRRRGTKTRPSAKRPKKPLQTTKPSGQMAFRL